RPWRSASSPASRLAARATRSSGALRNVSCNGEESPAATIAIFSLCGPRSLNAQPSTIASTSGKMNTQNTASGSRMKASTRARGSAVTALSLTSTRRILGSVVAQVTTREAHEDVLERRPVRAQVAERDAAPAHEVEQRRERLVRRAHVQNRGRVAGLHAQDAGKRRERVVGEPRAVFERELDQALGAERVDEHGGAARPAGPPRGAGGPLVAEGTRLP